MSSTPRTCCLPGQRLDDELKAREGGWVPAFAKMSMRRLLVHPPWHLHLAIWCALSTASPITDAFYSVPDGFSAHPVGAVLRQRTLPFTLPPPLDSLVADGRQVLFRTTSNDRQPAVAATTVLYPHGANDSSPLLSYQIAYDSPNPVCAPSFTFARDVSLAGSLDEIVVAAALEQGWIVNLPDHEGINAAYLCGPQAAFTIWDSIRAVPRVNSTRSPVALWGYSGGAIATEWALEFQQSYSPDTSVVGAALGGLDPDPTTAYQTVNRGPFAGFAAAGALGMAAGSPAFSSYLDTELLPAARPNFDQILRQCGIPSSFAFSDIDDNFRNGANFTTNAVWNATVRTDGRMGLRGVPRTPLWVYAAVEDEFSPISETDQLVEKYCAMEVPITYQRVTLGEHVTVAITGTPGALRFLQQSFQGRRPVRNCTTSTVTRDVLTDAAGLNDRTRAALTDLMSRL